MVKNRFKQEPVPCSGYRVIDVNLNRSREALRVCEDVTRFILNDKKLTQAIKGIRHKISAIADEIVNSGIVLIKNRNIKSDIGSKKAFDKIKKTAIQLLFYKNVHRAQESIRSLEEFLKIYNNKFAMDFKGLRFKVYSVEKKAIKKLQDYV